MKLYCEVIGVETTGDGLKITLQGNGSADAEWRAMERQTITIAATPAACRSYYVGRRVIINTQPA